MTLDISELVRMGLSMVGFCEVGVVVNVCDSGTR
jgi:hypothetical protein